VLPDITVFIPLVLLTRVVLCVISGFRRTVDENCALLGYYAASSGTFLLIFRRQPMGPIFKGHP